MLTFFSLFQMIKCYRHVYVLYGLHDSTHVYIFWFLMFHLWFCLILLDVKINLYQCQCQCQCQCQYCVVNQPYTYSTSVNIQFPGYHVRLENVMD